MERLHKSAIATSVLLGVSIVSTLSKIEAETERFDRGVYMIEALILFTAFSFYILIIDRAKNTKTLRLRYFDWVLTTPMMLLVLILIYSEPREGDTVWTALGNNTGVSISVSLLAVAMVSAGAYARREGGNSFWGLAFGSAFLAAAFVHLGLAKREGLSESPFPFSYTVVLWSLYAVAYRLPEQHRHTMYNFLDLLAKPVFALILAYGNLMPATQERAN